MKTPRAAFGAALTGGHTCYFSVSAASDGTRAVPKKTSTGAVIETAPVDGDI